MKGQNKEKHGFRNLFQAQKGRFQPEPFDPEKQYAVIRSSICTGEKVAGFKNKDDGRFYEVILIRSAEDVRRFKETYDLDTVKTEY